MNILVHKAFFSTCDHSLGQISRNEVIWSKGSNILKALVSYWNVHSPQQWGRGLPFHSFSIIVFPFQSFALLIQTKWILIVASLWYFKLLVLFLLIFSVDLMLLCRCVSFCRPCILYLISWEARPQPEVVNWTRYLLWPVNWTRYLLWPLFKCLGVFPSFAHLGWLSWLSGFSFADSWSQKTCRTASHIRVWQLGWRVWQLMSLPLQDSKFLEGL